MTTQEKLNKLMNCDPLMTAFIVDAIINRAEEVIKNETEVREYLKNGVINADVWINIAKELRETFGD